MTEAAHPITRCSDDELIERTRWMQTDMKSEVVEDYLRGHLARLRSSLAAVPPAQSGTERLLDLGCYGVVIPWYVDLLGYRDITGVALEPRETLNENTKKVKGKTDIRLSFSYFNVEEAIWPFEDESFDVVLCFELLEHMACDPMHLMEQLNRVMRSGGLLVLSTPNAASWASLARTIVGGQPYNFSVFLGVDGLVNRHNREYVPGEVRKVLEAGGMSVESLSTFGEARLSTSLRLMARLAGLAAGLTGRCPASLRGQVVLATGRKTGPVRDRWPRWLYIDPRILGEGIAERGEKGRRRLAEWK